MSSHSRYRLAIATCAAMPSLHDDDRRLLAALQALDIDALPCVWSDTDVDWQRFDAVLLRSTWDYFEHYAAFRDWLAALPVATINPRPLLQWNSDKHYLLDLAERGVAIVPTVISRASKLDEAVRQRMGSELVVKPLVSGGAWHTVRGTAGDTAFSAAIAALPATLDFMLQPFLPQIVGDGEWSLLYFGGRYSHAVIKRPAPGDYRVQAQFGGSADAVTPPAHVLDAAERALAAATAMDQSPIDYARVDGVIVDGQFLLMELEMIEPYLHLGAHPPAAGTFAHVLRRRLLVTRPARS